ncbi:MAG: hypothetical protein L6Q98_11010, partial [Anaerolineae bacterium]|nr:hypothetical protein [Anaerolineae bacterium]
MENDDGASLVKRRQRAKQLRDCLQTAHLTPFRCAQPPLSNWRGAGNRQVSGVRLCENRLFKQS